MFWKQNDRIKELVYLKFILYPFLYSELEQNISLVEFFELFKRFSIVIGQGIGEVEVDENEQFILNSKE